MSSTLIAFLIGLAIGFVYGCAVAYHRAGERLGEMERRAEQLDERYQDLDARVKEHVL